MCPSSSRPSTSNQLDEPRSDCRIPAPRDPAVEFDVRRVVALILPCRAPVEGGVGRQIGGHELALGKRDILHLNDEPFAVASEKGKPFAQATQVVQVALRLKFAPGVCQLRANDAAIREEARLRDAVMIAVDDPSLSAELPSPQS